uniref:F-box domain-containing protein n=1 Tax=Setaria italica TaxID=4555 RepID=K3ZMP2_SETIT
MSSPRKRCRGAFTASPPPPEATTTPASAPALPSDLVLEVVARSDVATLLRCAASCKPLRRDILNPAFIRRPGRVPGFPANALRPGASSDARRGVPLGEAPRAVRVPRRRRRLRRPPGPLRARDVAPRLVVLRRRHADVPRELGICVYDPMNGGRAFLPDPPEMARYSPDDGFSTYVLLTASDGIGCSFLLLAADFTMLLYPARSVKVLTVSSPDAGGGEWSPVTSAATHRRSHCSLLHADCSAVVLGGAVHWVMYGTGYHLHVLTYDVRAATAGSVELPMDRFPKSYREGNDANLRRRRRRTGSSPCSSGTGSRSPSGGCCPPAQPPFGRCTP